MIGALTPGDLSLFVNRVFTAGTTVFLYGEFLCHGSLVFIGDVVVSLALLAGKFDQVSHEVLPGKSG